MARAFTNLEFVLIGREEYDKLTADHAEVAELRARNERQKRGIRQLGGELGRASDRAERAEADLEAVRDGLRASHLVPRETVDRYRMLFQAEVKRAEKAEADVVKAIEQRDEARAELEQCRALLNAVDTIKKTRGAVQIAGVRIEPCDTYGKTDTTRAVDALLDQAEADAQTIDRIIRDRDKARQEAQQALKVLGEKLDEVPLWLGLQDPWLAQYPGPV